MRFHMIENPFNSSSGFTHPVSATCRRPLNSLSLVAHSANRELERSWEIQTSIKPVRSTLRAPVVSPRAMVAVNLNVVDKFANCSAKGGREKLLMRNHGAESTQCRSETSVLAKPKHVIIVPAERTAHEDLETDVGWLASDGRD